MLYLDLLKDTMNLYLDLLASRLDQPWFYLQAHHNLILKPYVKFIMLRSLSSVAQILSQVMNIIKFHQWATSWSSHEICIDTTLFTRWTQFWCLKLSSPPFQHIHLFNSTILMHVYTLIPLNVESINMLWVYPTWNIYSYISWCIGIIIHH
jgi:hypothetical protein